jgi:transposase
LLAQVLFEMFGQHQPRNRQAERYAREGVDISLSTLADQIGACAAALASLHRLIAGHVLGAERLQGDGTTVPVLAKRQDGYRTAVDLRPRRVPHGGPAPPATLFHYSRDRRAEHPVRHLEGGIKARRVPERGSSPWRLVMWAAIGAILLLPLAAM